jgi:hypothetical protein
MIKSLRGDLRLCMLTNIYFAKFQCLTRCGIILWGGGNWERTDPRNKKKCFVQLNGLNEREYCRQIFRVKDSYGYHVLYLWGVGLH